ncbi:MAG: hypothetical protein FWB78_09740, partial [Treponema sp.]|nr:hypothetical protein [Treponema sp.]
GTGTEGGNQTPVASHYTFGNMTQTAGSVTAVIITANLGASPGAVVNIRYDGDAEIPQTPGTFAVTFDVEAAEGWYAAAGLFAGNLVVEPETWEPPITDPVMELVMVIPNPWPQFPGSNTDIAVEREIGSAFTVNEVKELMGSLSVVVLEVTSARFSRIRFMSDVPDAFDNGNHVTPRGIRVVLNDGEHFGIIYLDRTSGWTFQQDIIRGGTRLEQLRSAMTVMNF